MTKRLIVLAIVFAFLLLAGCSEKKSEINYFEISKQDPECGNEKCLSETIVFSDGTIFEKTDNTPDFSNSKIVLMKTLPENAQALIKFAEEKIPNSYNADCFECQIYHVYSFNGEKLKV
ncbi:MAG: hypothetical protein Q7K42_03070, partial [Candidatus Diapherotrites archaeon]|nr:hypothetical protein [Candidatus Diapherotrites archaeon]